jgi:Family of unknown function (DUF6624)
LSNPIRTELLSMIEEDNRVRNELAADGSLFEGYHPRMEEVHRKNSARLRQIIAEFGWPGTTLVQEDGEEAAWRIAQHSIGEPHFMRSALNLLKNAVHNDEAPFWQVAYMEDRIRSIEGRPQLYGTSFDWDENGEMSPFPEIEDAEHVDERRASAGLIPMEEEIKKRRAQLMNEKPPKDLEKWRTEMDAWARSVGWRL